MVVVSALIRAFAVSRIGFTMGYARPWVFGRYMLSQLDNEAQSMDAVFESRVSTDKYQQCLLIVKETRASLQLPRLVTVRPLLNPSCHRLLILKDKIPVLMTSPPRLSNNPLQLINLCLGPAVSAQLALGVLPCALVLAVAE